MNIKVSIILILLSFNGRLGNANLLTRSVELDRIWKMTLEFSLRYPSPHIVMFPNETDSPLSQLKRLSKINFLSSVYEHTDVITDQYTLFLSTNYISEGIKQTFNNIPFKKNNLFLMNFHHEQDLQGLNLQYNSLFFPFKVLDNGTVSIYEMYKVHKLMETDEFLYFGQWDKQDGLQINDDQSIWDRREDLKHSLIR